MGHDKLPHQISVCPLLPRHQELQTRIEIPSRLLQHRASCVTFKAVQDANVAAISAKTAAASTANPGEETGCRGQQGLSHCMRMASTCWTSSAPTVPMRLALLR